MLKTQRYDIFLTNLKKNDYILLKIPKTQHNDIFLTNPNNLTS